MAVIFDLDMTIIDSSIVEPLRRARQWPAVYQNIPKLTPYAGIIALLQELKDRGIGTAIVTSSPRPYCEKVISHWKIPIDITICYHDTKLHKPNPEPIIKAIEHLNVSSSQAVSIGDTNSDILAAKAAGVLALTALWGVVSPSELLNADPQYTFSNVVDLRSFLLTHYLHNFGAFQRGSERA